MSIVKLPPIKGAVRKKVTPLSINQLHGGDSLPPSEMTQRHVEM